MKKISGFTLLELMATLAILAVVMAFALPNIRDIIINNRLATQANDFIAALTVARSEAIKRRVTMRVQAWDVANNADTANWALGWQVIDTTNNEVIREFNALEGGSTLVEPNSGITEIDYVASGTLAGGLAGQIFELRHPECTGDQARDISIGTTGRGSVARVNCP